MKLNPRQKRAATKLFNRKGIALWWKVGRGKTRVVYRAFASVAKRCKSLSRYLVVARREAFYDWEQEVYKCHLDWRVVYVESPDDFFLGQYEKRPVVYLLSHGKLAAMRDLIVDLASRFEAVAFDEGWLYKNPTTQRCKAAQKISEAIDFASILSGSVMTARDLTDVYGQLYAINKHRILARTLTQFRSRFMYRFQLNPAGDNQACAWRNRKGAHRKVSKLVTPVASVYIPSGSDRKVVERTIRIPASQHQRAAFDQLREYFEYTTDDGERLELRNAPSVITKCQQASDGWIKLAGERRVPIQSSKMDYLVTLVENIIEQGDQVVIWTAFIHSARMILQRLQKKFGRQVFIKTGKDPFDPVAWKKRGMICVSTEASGSSVNHFKDCAYAIYYSMNFKWHDLQQSKGRTDRNDSKHKTCYYYYLMTKGSLDSTVYRAALTSGREERDLINNVKVKAWLKN